MLRFVSYHLEQNKLTYPDVLPLGYHIVHICWHVLLEAHYAKQRSPDVISEGSPSVQ